MFIPVTLYLSHCHSLSSPFLLPLPSLSLYIYIYIYACVCVCVCVCVGVCARMHIKVNRFTN